MATNQKMIQALEALVESSQIANKTNLAILERLESQQGGNDNSELVAQFTKAMESKNNSDLVPVVSSETVKQANETRIVKVSKTSGEIVQEYLDANPDIENSHTLRELEEIIGISYSTIRRVLKKMGRM